MHSDSRAPRRTTHGSAMSVMYGAAGARGEAPADFPHVRRALKELAAPRRVGVTEAQARLGALLTVTSTLRDSERPHVTEPLGLRHIHVGARTVPLATGTPRWRGSEPLFARASSDDDSLRDVPEPPNDKPGPLRLLTLKQTPEGPDRPGAAPPRPHRHAGHHRRRT
ncbi:triphosphoribosyl-dephospho-CoA synthase [Streptomyces sp. SudanB5_2050]|uniref:triphosphoribosyl-dephospho-CoA synthase n=1 Tax=Streptomyces sp. SudanB5_2050 TaxID=3035274 RepID=UPI0036DD3E7F